MRIAALIIAVTWTGIASAEIGTYQRRATISGYASAGPGYAHAATFESPKYGRRGGDHGGMQRRSGSGSGRGHTPHRPMNGPGPSAKSVDSGWFQRPYPYHLDYYRMRFHGSYAPYFGNYNAPPTNFNVGPTFAPGFGVGMYPPYAGWGQGPAAILPHQGGAVAPAPVAP